MMFGIVRRFVFFALLSFIVAVPGFAADPCACLTPMDRQTIQAWYGGGLAGLPQASSAKVEGPNEFQKTLKKNAALPAGLQSKLQPLPPGLESQLSPAPKGHKRAAADRYVLVIAESGSVVTDFVDYTRRIGHVSWATSMWR